MITLRKLEPTDLPYLYQWENDAASWPDGANHNPLSQADLRDYITSTTGDIFRDGQLRLIIEGDGVCGALDLFDLDNRNRRLSVGIYIAPEFRRQGIAHQALEQVKTLVFRHLGMRLLIATVVSHNTASMTLFQRAGFTPVATLPAWTLEGDAVIYSCLQS